MTSEPDRPTVDPINLTETKTLPPTSPPADTTTGPPSETTAAVAAAVPVHVPGYEVLGELGRGGMGVVYKARQLRLNRVVALKMILVGGHASEADLFRFRTEAEAVARLQHPNIIQIHEVGEHGGLPFFSLEFCPGGNLERKLNGTPLPPKEAARLVETLARAVHAAHQQHVIHRDLKPANVLLAENGTPKITDFGLAKKLDEAGRTQSGAVMGTPSYMAPEQAGGKSKETGPLCDVYALGAILYECLTGRPPFKAATPLDTILQVVADEPAPPRQLQSKTPRDLETICLKCLEKVPGKRYASAEALAEDLRRFQAGEPVLAQPPTLGYLLRKQLHRYRTPLAVAAGVLLLLAAVVVGAFVQVMGARDEAVRKGNDLEKKEGELRGALNEKQDALNAKQQTLDSLNKQLSLSARSYADYSDTVYRAGNVRDCLNWMLRAYEVAPANDRLRPSYLRLIACRGRPLSDVTLWHDGEIRAASFSPDGRTVVTASADRTARLWDAQSGKELQRLTHGDVVTTASFSPDGRTVVTASADKMAWLWDAQSGKLLRQFTHEDMVHAASFSPDGRTVLTASWDKTARLWDAQSGKELLRLTHDGPVVAASFSPDGRSVVTASDDKTARLWAAQSGKELLRLTHDGPVVAASFSPDGRSVLTASWDARLWDAQSGKEMLRLTHDATVRAASFSPDGRSVLTAGYDNTARLWDAQSGKKLLQLHEVHAASFSSDGHTIITAGEDKTARLWDAQSGKELQRFPHDAAVLAASLSPDGRKVLTASEGQSVRLWDAQSGKEMLRLTHDGAVAAASFSPDGCSVVTASYDNTARLWDAQSGKEMQRFPHDAAVLAASFSPDGRTVVTASVDKTARLWDVGFLSIPDDVNPDRLRAWVLVRSGQDFTDEGTLRPLRRAEWQQQRQILDAKGGDWQTPPDPRKWHLAQAAAAETDKAWFAARFHLNWLLKDDPTNDDLLRRRDEAEAHMKAP